MGDNYVALIDPTATAADARAKADRLLEAFVSHGIIHPESSEECTLGGLGHLPGPRIDDYYAFPANQHSRWDTLWARGVEIIAEKWVNTCGFIAFHHTECPACRQKFNDDAIGKQLSNAMGVFLESDDAPTLCCPKCREVHDVRSWTTLHHLGFCHLALVFWNWPPFNSDGWRLSIPELASRTIGVGVIETYGKT